MSIILTDHAKKRMAVTFKQIQETIEMPEYTVQKGKKTKAYKKFNEKN